MVVSASNWIKENVAVYIGNATNVRDFRSQLRGNKPIILWMSYLVILILIMSLAYQGILSDREMSISSIQRQLSEFYMVLMALLGGLIAIVTPSLTATTVIAERQRKSLDLIFSAPVSLKYYLVGKMLSSLRYTWMLLILALPISAVCVVMGGATWQNVLAAYAILTGASLVFTSLGLLISVMAGSLVSSVIWTYLIAGAYCIFTSAMGSIPTAMRFSTGRDLEANWIIGINPFGVALASPTYTTLFGLHVPNWILALVYSVIVCKLLLLGAASAMSSYGGKEIFSFRVHLTLVLLFLGYLLGTTFTGTARVLGTGGGMVTAVSTGPVAAIAGWFTAVLALGMPIYACFGAQEDRRYRPDGFVKLSRTFMGTPSGSLPFAVLLVLCFYTGTGLCLALSSAAMDYSLFAASFAWSLCYTAFWWSVARLASSLSTTLKTARLVIVAIFIIIIALPLPVLSILSSAARMNGSNDNSIFAVYALYPLSFTDPSITKFLAYGLAALIFAIGLSVLSYIRMIPSDRSESRLI